MLIGAMLKDLRLKGSPAMGGGEQCQSDVDAAEHHSGLLLTFEGFDLLNEEVKLLTNLPFHHLLPHAEVAHAGDGEPARCPPQIANGEEHTWNSRTTQIHKCLPHNFVPSQDHNFLEAKMEGEDRAVFFSKLKKRQGVMVNSGGKSLSQHSPGLSMGCSAQVSGWVLRFIAHPPSVHC